MSGTGKSAVIAELAARGYKAVDLDGDEWSEWVACPAEPGEPAQWQGRDWVWREDRISRLLAAEDAGVLFVAGCASNQGKFRSRFDVVILLSAPAEVIVERLASRTSNAYGKGPGELARVLRHLESIEPLLRRSATHEIDTRAPLAEVVAAVIGLV